MVNDRPTVYNTSSVYKEAGGGVIPVPDGYKELLYIAPDCDENSVRYNEAAYCDLGQGNNTDIWNISIFDITKLKQWYINNNIGTSTTYFMMLSNGKTRNLECRLNSSDFEISYYAEGYYSGTPTVITPNLYNIKIDGKKAVIGNTTINNGGGTISAGNASYTYPFGFGTSIPPIKLGCIKIFNTQDILLHDWRPVEKLGGGDNRFGYYDILNNVFKASIRPGHYFVPGPEV